MSNLDVFRRFLLEEVMVDTSYNDAVPPGIWCGPSRAWVLTRDPETAADSAEIHLGMGATARAYAVRHHTDGMEVF
jgi:hypothetical protein